MGFWAAFLFSAFDPAMFYFYVSWASGFRVWGSVFLKSLGIRARS